MKKIIKITVSLVVLAAVMLGVSSCAFIDDMRDHRMTLVDDSGDRIEFRGKTYKKLPSSELDFVSCYFTSFYSDENGNYSLSKRDVPLLISGTIGEEVQYAADVDVIVRSEQGTIAYSVPSSDRAGEESGETLEIYYNAEPPRRTYYCTEENYERYSELLTSASLTTLCADWSGAYDSQFSALSETASRVILDAASSGDKVSEAKREDILTNGGYIMSFIACDSDLIVCSADVYEINRLNDSYYLYYAGNYYLLPDSVSEELTALKSKINEFYSTYYYEGY